MANSYSFGGVLKSLFKPISINAKYTLFDNLKEKDISLKEWLDCIKNVECPQSLDRTCKNFDCYANYRLIHKIVYESEIE